MARATRLRSVRLKMAIHNGITVVHFPRPCAISLAVRDARLPSSSERAAATCLGGFQPRPLLVKMQKRGLLTRRCVRACNVGIPVGSQKRLHGVDKVSHGERGYSGALVSRHTWSPEAQHPEPQRQGTAGRIEDSFFTCHAGVPGTDSITMLTLWRRHLMACPHKDRGRLCTKCSCPV